MKINCILLMFLYISCIDKKAISNDINVDKNIQLRPNDTLLGFNKKAYQILNVKYLNEKKIELKNKRYIECGKFDPLHEVYSCMLNGSIKEGQFAVYEDSTFSTIKYRFNISKSKNYYTYCDYYENGSLMSYEESNDSVKTLFRFYENQVLGEIWYFINRKIVLEKEYDPNGKIIKINIIN
jgi:hypothetical protein